MAYDYLVVGAGLFGATFARMMADHGYKCLVIDKRDHIAGNCYDYDTNGITVHKYGAHIFHTSNEKVWNFVNRFSSFIQYEHHVKAIGADDKLYSMPFNMNTFNKLFKVQTPEAAKHAVADDIKRNRALIDTSSGLAKKAMSLVGPKVFETLVRHYTEKQWGRRCEELDESLISRLPLRFTYDDNYFNDKYQGLPYVSYTTLVRNILTHPDITVKLKTKFDSKFDIYADKVIYCGPIDEFFEYKLGVLEWRSLSFDTDLLKVENWQGCPVLNYCNDNVSFTRIIEHKHFRKQAENKTATIITHEYPAMWKRGDEPYYPVNNAENDALYRAYVEYAKDVAPWMTFGGRLGLYKYLDMDDTIAAAMTFAESEIWL